jgi:hypothetical protein
MRIRMLTCISNEPIDVSDDALGLPYVRELLRTLRGALEVLGHASSPAGIMATVPIPMPTPATINTNALSIPPPPLIADEFHAYEHEDFGYAQYEHPHAHTEHAHTQHVQHAQVDEGMVARLVEEVERQLGDAGSRIDGIRSGYIHSPSILHALRLASGTLSALQHEHAVYRQQLSHVRAQAHPSCVVGMYIAEQPFPKALSKGQRESVTLRVIPGACVSELLLESIHAECVNASGTASVAIEERTATLVALPSHDGYATHSAVNGSMSVQCGITFTTGTNNKAVAMRLAGMLRCSLINGAATQRPFQSDASEGLVVTTNSNQWDDAGAMLLERFSFRDAMHISVARFANDLQEFFLAGTGQQLHAPVRALSPRDLHYILTLKFGSKSVITHHDYDALWKWFGPGFSKLTHQRHLLPMWKRGLLLGYVSKEHAEQLLAHESDQTFVLRFSNNYAGKICISYRDEAQSEPIRHYLLRDTDMSGNARTLVHFLLEVQRFGIVLELTSNGEARRIAKKDAFANFLGSKKKNALDQKPGYDMNIPGLCE